MWGFELLQNFMVLNVFWAEGNTLKVQTNTCNTYAYLRYKIKSRRSNGGTGLSRRRVDNENLESENELSFTNNVEIQGNPTSTSYDFATLENFDPMKKVVIIIHGWAILNSKIQDTFRSQSRETVKMPEWVTTLQQRILEADDVNAVVFDWRGGAYHGYR